MTVVYLICPDASIPLGGPDRGDSFERFLVADPHGLAFNHHVEAFLPGVAAGGQNDMWVSPQVGCLLSIVGNRKVESPVVPHRHERRHMWPAVGPHRCEPE